MPNVKEIKIAEKLLKENLPNCTITVIQDKIDKEKS